MKTKQCYCMTTRRFTLRCGCEEQLKITQDFYNKVLLFYYRLFLRTEAQEPGRLADRSNQQALRELEVMTIVGRNGDSVPFPLPWKKVPLYFRRAAVNGAIGEARSWLGRRRAGMVSAETEHFQKGVTFYKGMFRDLTDRGVSLKLWDGQSWSWVNCRLKGRAFPVGAECLSPTLQLTAEGAMLNVPIRENVADGRKAKERMAAGTKICSLQFTNSDSFAVGVVLDSQGEETAVRFFRGGKEYAHLCHMRLDRIRRSGEAMGLKEYVSGQAHIPSGVERAGISDLPEESEEISDIETDTGSGREPERYNQKYWMKLKHLNDYYAHRVSREIVDFCVENQAGMIVLPRYDDRFAGYVMGRTGNWSVLHLSRRICTLLSYKAWQAGIVAVEVHAGGTSACCARCGEKVRKHGSEYICPRGHQGNRYLNTARNLGIKCLRGFGRAG